MNWPEIYLLLFTDTLVSNLAINNTTELVISSMKAFGLYNSFAVIVIATLSFMVAACINYLLGIVCYKVLSSYEERNINPLRNDPVLRLKSKWLILLLLIGWIPFWGKFITLFSGFLRINLKVAFLGTLLPKLAYYSYYILI